jgi:hypothetical protein
VKASGEIQSLSCLFQERSSVDAMAKRTVSATSGKGIPVDHPVVSHLRTQYLEPGLGMRSMEVRHLCGILKEFGALYITSMRHQTI